MKKLLSIVMIMVFVLSLVGCNSSYKVNKAKDIEFLTGQDGWYYYNPDTYENEKMSFHEDSSFYWGCECGEPIGDSDLYEFFYYDRDTGSIIVYNKYDGDEKVLKVVNYVEGHLMLKINGVLKEFIPFSNNYDFNQDKDYIKEYNAYLSTRSVKDDSLLVGPADYDGDVEYPEEVFRWYNMSDDIEFYNYSYESIEGKVSVNYGKMGLNEGLKAYESSSAFIWFNENMEISKVMYYGSLIVQ